MQTRSLIGGLALLLGSSPMAGSAQEAPSRGELHVWTTRAIATVLAEVGHDFERTSSYHLRVVSDLPPAFAQQVARRAL